jgi:hypothetical protein
MVALILEGASSMEMPSRAGDPAHSSFSTLCFEPPSQSMECGSLTAALANYAF